MHEMSLAESVVEIVAEAAAKMQALRVNAIWLEIGDLSCVAPDALRFCFEAVACGSLAEGARLEIISVPGEGVCAACTRVSGMSALYDLCPHCGAPGMQVRRGGEMRVVEIEVE